MRIAFLVNDIATEQDVYTTTRLAHAAACEGDEVWYVGVEDLAFSPDGRIIGRATCVPGEPPDTHVEYLALLQGERAVKRRIDVGKMDVLMLRNDPSADQAKRPWAQSVGIVFGHAAQLRGVLVLNDPKGLSVAMNKMYLEQFPLEVSPQTLITRDREELVGFVHAHEEGAILKPLQGSGGESVFLLRGEDRSNLNQIIDAVLRFGYVIAQEYIPEASERDTRLFLVEGEPLVVDGKVCAFSRVGAEGDVRTNLTAGGSAERAELNDRIFELAEIVRPLLVRDGMFLVGLDIAGGKILEINVFSPGGMGTAGELEKVDFLRPVLAAVERKLEAHRAAPSEPSRGAMVFV